MARQVTEYRCLLISPGDLEAERAALREVVGLWNAQVGAALNARVDLVGWETHSAPEMGKAPQDAVNRQIVDTADFAVALFWTRLGTPTANYASGSVEEVYRVLNRGARVLVYFSSRPIPQTALTGDQFAKLTEAKNKFEAEGLLGTFSDVAGLREKFNLHLTAVVSGLLQSAQPNSVPSAGAGIPTAAPAAPPDVRVSANAGFITPSMENIVQVEVRNYSSQLVFINPVFFPLRGGKGVLQPLTDQVTWEPQRRRELRPGESFSLNVIAANMTQSVTAAEIICAAVRDDLGREYRSSEDELRNLFKMYKQV